MFQANIEQEERTLALKQRIVGLEDEVDALRGILTYLKLSKTQLFRTSLWTLLLSQILTLTSQHHNQNDLHVSFVKLQFCGLLSLSIAKNSIFVMSLIFCKSWLCHY